MNTIIKSNPVYKLYNNHKDNIELSRKKLFSRLNKINPDIKKQVEELYNNRKANNPIPYLGELYPWVISEIFDFNNNKKVQEISQDWLALYYYTIFTDDVIDSDEKQFVGGELITLTALMKEGLFKLYKSVINTPYEKQFEEAINSVLNQGKIEEKNSNKITSKNIKAEYSSKKNDLIKLCTFALISVCSETEKKEAILNFTDKLQLSFQYLDDLADIKEDFKDNNYTVILNELLHKVKIENVQEDNLIALLIEKNVLQNFVNEIDGLFIDIFSLLSNKKNNHSLSFFEMIYDNIHSFNIYLQGIDLSLFKDVDNLYRKNTFIMVEKHIEIVAQSS